MSRTEDALTSTSNAIGVDLARVLPNDGVPWYRKKHLLFLNYCAFSLALLSAANGYDGSLMNGLQALPQWNDFMSKPTGSWLGFINALQSLSTTLGNPIVAYFANRYGRKKGLLVGYFFIVVAAILQGLTPNSKGFVIGRVFAGQPTAWWSGLAPLLITELAYPTHRGTLTSLYNCGWYVGSTVAAWATFGCRNYDSDWAWRIPCFFTNRHPSGGLARCPTGTRVTSILDVDRKDGRGSSYSYTMPRWRGCQLALD